MEPHPWIDLIWFGAFTALAAFAALYPVRLLRALNYGRLKGLPGPRAVRFFQFTAAFAAVGGVLGLVLGWFR